MLYIVIVCSFLFLFVILVVIGVIFLLKVLVCWVLLVLLIFCMKINNKYCIISIIVCKIYICKIGKKCLFFYVESLSLIFVYKGRLIKVCL